MNKILNFFLEHRLLSFLLTVQIIIAGGYSLAHLNREAFPDVSFDMVTIRTIYAGASAEECEQLISIPIEKQIKQIGGIDKVRSFNIENVSYMVVYLEEGLVNPSKTVQDIKDAIDQVDNLPSGAETPFVEELKLDKTELIYAAIYPNGENTSYQNLKDVADEFEDFVYDLDGVAKVDNYGYNEKEYLVEVDPRALQLYRIDLGKISNALDTRNQDMPGGSIKIGQDEFILRTKSAYNRIDEIRNTIVMSNLMGNATRIKDIARVTSTFEEPSILEHFKGKEAIIMAVWKKKTADQIRLSDELKEKFNSFQNPHPGQVNIEFFNDASETTRTNISSVITNAITGFVLLAAILFLSMGFRIAALVTAGLPLAFLIAFTAMKSLGLTINVISLFGLIMVLGMIVDFSIVVAENAHRYLEQGYKPREAVRMGVEEVFAPVTVTLFSIVATFSPLLMMTGLIGKFIIAIPAVLIVSLVSSWFIAFFILPAFLALFLKEKKSTDGLAGGEPGGEEKIYDSGPFGYVQRFYGWTLGMSLRFRYLTFGSLLGLLAFSFTLLPVVGFVFMPGGGSKMIEVKTLLPRTRNLDMNAKQIGELEKMILQLPENELVALRSRIGIHQSKITDPKPGEGSHRGHLFVYLTDETDRTRTAEEIAADLRQKFEAAKESGTISSDLFTEIETIQHGPPQGKPVNVEIRGKDFPTLLKIAAEYQEFLSGVDGVRDISIDLEEGKTEFQYSINDELAARTGISAQDAARSLFGAFEGFEATSIKEGDKDVTVRVRYPRSLSNSRDILQHVYISNRQGGMIPLHLVTEMKEATGYAGINRYNYKRIIQVQAQVNTEVTTSLEVNRLLAKEFSSIEDRYPGNSISYGGEQEDTKKSMTELGLLFLIALLAIYMLLTFFFGSLSIPLVIMSAIPFSLVGVILALLLHGEPLSFMSVLGIFSLAGVIVSNTLVLVQFIQNLMANGRTLKQALIDGGVIRLRPVLLTTGTTVLGLFPTIYGLGDKNYFVAPLALSFGYGLIFATFITLILIPTLLHIQADFFNLGEIVQKLIQKLKNYRTGQGIPEYHAEENR